MTTTHTPTPWRIEEDNLGCKNIGADAEPEGFFSLGYTHGLDSEDIDLANAAFIVQACNSHDALLAAAEAGLTALYEAQGEWADVLPPYAPEWTYPLKDAAEDLETAIKLAKEGVA